MVKSEGTEDWLVRYFEGSLSEEEAVQVKEWMQSSEENFRIAGQIQKLILAADLAEVSPKLDVDQALATLHRKMDGGKDAGYRFKVMMRRAQQVAAVLFIPLIAAVCLLLWKHRNDIQQAEMIQVRTNPGMITSVVLPDSSVVVLNSSSVLSYPSKFIDEKREVQLDGEAFFSVQKDAKKQFVVHTADGSQIAVYGTEFNVEAYAKDRMVETTLVSGKVSFNGAHDGMQKSMMLKPGQKAVYDVAQKKVALSSANLEVETSWKDGKLVFRNTPFDDIMKSLSKRFNVRFVVKNEKLKQNSFTGVFEHQRLERILEIFRISSNIKFRFVESGNMEDEQQVIEVY